MLPQEKNHTIDDIYALPEGTRAELIDGNIYYMAPPNLKHQRISMGLSRIIANYLRQKNGSCEVFSAPFAVFLNNTDAKYVEPDISVICDKDKLNNKGCKGAPDWIIEIVSQSSRRMDYHIKLFKYRSAGVREYWIVDHEKNRIMIYDFENEDTKDYTFQDVVKVGIYKDFSIDFSQLNL